MNSSGPALNFFNVSYFFNQLYQLMINGQWPDTSSIVGIVATIWFIFSIVSYIATLICIAIIVYYSIRLAQTTDEVHQKYGTIPEKVAHQQVEHSRWVRIKQLIESPLETDWRAAIIEADIMLDESLTRRGYPGNTVGEKLKAANPAQFHTLQEAWDAHNVRNNIAHQGTEYQLSPNIAYRTIGHFENVFRELGEI